MRNLLFACTVLGFSLFGCKGTPESGSTSSAPTDSLQTASVYECPMKCDNKTYDKPGKCTVCGMDLIVKN